MENLIGIILMNRFRYKALPNTYDKLINELIAFIHYKFYVDAIVNIRIVRYFNE